MALESYTTLAGYGTSTYEEKKSVFIGEATSVTTEEEAIAFVASVKAKYPDARHHVYAYLLRENSKNRYSDDHEPQGTAGLPVLDVLRKGGFTDGVIVVTRYFGGTLLGAGGLVRAYTAAAKEALSAAGIAEGKQMTVFSLRLSYSDHPRVQPLLSGNVTVNGVEYAEGVEVCGMIPSEEYAAFEKKLGDATAGRAFLSVVKDEMILVPILNTD